MTSKLKKALRISAKIYARATAGAFEWASWQAALKGSSLWEQFHDQADGLNYLADHIEEDGFRGAYIRTVGYLVGRSAERHGHYDVVSTIQRLAQEAEKQANHIH